MWFLYVMFNYRSNFFQNFSPFFFGLCLFVWFYMLCSKFKHRTKSNWNIWERVWLCFTSTGTKWMGSGLLSINILLTHCLTTLIMLVNMLLVPFNTNKGLPSKRRCTMMLGLICSQQWPVGHYLFDGYVSGMGFRYGKFMVVLLPNTWMSQPLWISLLGNNCPT